MIANPSIRNFLDENQMLEKQILEHPDEVSFEFFTEWSSNQQKMGEHLANIAFCAIAKKYDSYILSNPVNPASYAHFLRSDVQSKTFTIRARTLRNGIRSGFLESESGMKLLDFWIQGQQLYAVERAGKECLVKQAIVSDRYLPVSCYEDGLFIVSDVDLVSIFSRENSDKIIFDSLYGELTAQEFTIIRDVNQYFQTLVSNYYAFAAPSLFRVIAHGPANRFSHSKASHLHYPMKVYTPQSSIEFLDREFLNFNRKVDSLGYHVYLNPQWEF